jgi:hypothetical protein
VLSILLAALQVVATVPTISVPTDANFQAEGRYLPLSACAAGASDTAHVVIGGESLVFAAAAVQSFTPARVEATGNVKNPGVMQLVLGATTGCPETPLAAMVLGIDAGSPALPFGLLLAGTAPAVTSRQMASMRDSGQCDGSLPDFVACGGSVRVGDEQVEVVALIAKTGLSRDDGALFAICETVNGQPMCEVQGGRETLSYKGVLASGVPTVEALAAADAAAFDLIQRRP